MGTFCKMNQDSQVQSNKGNERNRYKLIGFFNSSSTPDQNDRLPYQK